MVRRYNNRGTRLFSLVGLLLALSLTVAVPSHANHRFLACYRTAHARLRTAHHTVVDRGDSRRAYIDREGWKRSPGQDSAAASLVHVPDVLAAAPALVDHPQPRVLRHLQIGPSHGGNEDLFG